MVAVIAATAGTLLAPIIRRLAAGVGFVDRPDAHHKRHNDAVPLGGGLLVFLSAIIGLGAVAVAGTLLRGERRPAASGPPDSAGTDFSDRFAGYEPADEPDGDLSKVVWPAFVTRHGPEVQRLYEFQITNGALMKYIPCFCGCGSDGHRSNRDCYVQAVNPDGSVVLDPMAPT